MSSRLYLKAFSLLSLVLPFLLPGGLSVQAQLQSGQFLEGDKPVVDYYEDLDDKTYYHQKRIHGMKGELNNYSQKLHNLQKRFDEIFYGLSSQRKFSTPFDLTNQPSRPESGRFEYNSTLPSIEERRPRASLIEEVREPVVDQLAFNVQSPGEFTGGDQAPAASSKTSAGSSGSDLGKYLILSPAVAFPHRTQDNADSLRKYDPGMAVSLAAGFRNGGARFGLGASFKKHSFHKDALNKGTGSALTGSSETIAAYLDLGYEVALVGSLEGYAGLGLGYFTSRTDDPLNRREDGFFATGALGLSYQFTHLFALRLGYRYYHEEEVPAHLSELGFDFDF